MARKPISKNTSTPQAVVALSRPLKKLKAELPYPIIRHATNNSVLYPIDAIDGTTAKLTLPAGARDVVLYMAIKGQDEPVFDPVLVEDGIDVVEISAQSISECIGHTVLFKYMATVGGSTQTSQELELEVQHIREEHLVASRPVFVNSKNESNTWWLRMFDFTGDEIVEISAWPMIYEGQRYFLTVAGNQHVVPYRFIWVASDYVVQRGEAHAGHVFRFTLSRQWLSRLADYSAITAHSCVIWDRTAPVFPELGDPSLENPLPVNGQDFHLRTTSLLQVDPIQDLNPPHLLESVELPPDHWQVNPTNTVDGAHAIVNYEGMFEGDHVCAYASGPNYGPVALGCKDVKKGETSLSFDVAPEIIAALFYKTLTLKYSLQFDGYQPQESPERVITVLGPQLTIPGIEQATGSTVDLNTFNGNATGVVPIWDYAALGQCCWMWLTGVLEDDSPYRFEILTDEPLTANWLATGVDTPIPRDELKKLADCSDFDLHFAVAFDGKCDRTTAIEFSTQAFKIEQEPLKLSAPKVTEAVGSDLTVWNGRNGVHIDVDYLGNNAKHTISACWQKPDSTCWPLASIPGSAQGAVIFFLPPEAVIESMGKTVPITYTVTTACKMQTSASLNLTISQPTRLETPNVLQATPPRAQNAVLDLRTFTGNADSLEDTMWFLRAGQKCWLRATGTKKDGTAYSFVVYAARTITEPEVISGIAHPVLRAELEKAKDGSAMTFTFSVTTDGSSDESHAVICPSRVLIVRMITMVKETFESLAKGYYSAGTVLNTPLMTVRHHQAIVGVHEAYGGDPDMTSGVSIAFSCSDGEGELAVQQVDFVLKSGYSRIRLGYKRHLYYGHFVYYNALGVRLGERIFSQGGPYSNWVDFSAPGGELINKIVVYTRQHSFTDNWELYS